MNPTISPFISKSSSLYMNPPSAINPINIIYTHMSSYVNIMPLMIDPHYIPIIYIYTPTFHIVSHRIPMISILHWSNPCVCRRGRRHRIWSKRKWWTPTPLENENPKSNFCRWKDPILVVIPCSENWYVPTIVPSVKVVSNSSWNFTLAMPPFFLKTKKHAHQKNA